MAFTQGHALLIGVGTHRHTPAIDMPITADDAKALASVLHDSKLCGYLPEQVHILHDDSATQAGILAALDELAQRSMPGDSVLLFYSGHGAFGHDGHYYLVSHDARIEDRQVAADSGVSDAALLHKLRTIPAQHVLMVFNTHHTGSTSPLLEIGNQALLDQTLSSTNLPDELAAALLATGTGRIVMTASREGQRSYTGNGLLTIFTQTIFDGLRGIGTCSNQGYLSAFNLYEHTYRTVSATVMDAYKMQQEPELTVMRGMATFAVALYKGEVASHDGTADEPLPRDVAVREVETEQSQRLSGQVIRSGARYRARYRAQVPPGATAQPLQAAGVNSGAPVAATYQQATAPEQQHLVDLIKQIRRAIQTSDMDDAEKGSAFRHLDEVDMQLTEPEPRRDLIERELNQARDVVSGAAGAGSHAELMRHLVQQTLELAQQLYQ